MQAIMARSPINSQEVLVDVNRKAVFKALKRSKGGIPRPIQFTNAPIEESNLAKMPSRDKAYLYQLCRQVQEEPLRVIPELLALQKQYPKVPAIANYLCLSYMHSQQEELYFATLMEARERFPEYLFGKIGLAEYYLNHQEHTQVPKTLEKKYEIWQHCPNVEVFHVSEVRSFFSVVGTYFARCNQIARALYHYCMLVDIAPDHHATKRVGDEIILKELNKVTQRFSKRA